MFGEGAFGEYAFQESPGGTTGLSAWQLLIIDPLSDLVFLVELYPFRF